MTYLKYQLNAILGALSCVLLMRNCRGTHAQLQAKQEYEFNTETSTAHTQTGRNRLQTASGTQAQAAITGMPLTVISSGSSDS